jgi:hypothetical protein
MTLPGFTAQRALRKTAHAYVGSAMTWPSTLAKSTLLMQLGFNSCAVNCPDGSSCRVACPFGLCSAFCVQGTATCQCIHIAL